MAAATVSVTHNTNTKTIVYTFSEKVYFDLISGATTGTKIEGADTVDITKFAFYKPALDGTYAAPDATAGTGNLDTNCTITSIVFPTAGTTLTIVYSGVFPAISATAFGYTCYPILYKAYTDAADTDSSANHIQAVFNTPVIIPTVNCQTYSADTNDVTPLAISLNAGATLETTYADQKILLMLVNADTVNAETVTIYKGDSIQGTQDISTSIAKSTTSFIMLESGKHKFIYHDGLKNKYYLRGTADVSVAAIILP